MKSNRGENERQAPVPDGAGPAPGDSPHEHLKSLLERCSLTRSQAKTLVAVMRLGSCTTSQLSPIIGIDSTNLYRVLESLALLKLIRKVPASSAIWVARESDEVIERLLERERERLRQTEATLDEVRSAMKMVPGPPETASVALQVGDGPTLASRYLEAVASIEEELLVFNRGPYVGELAVDDAVRAAVARGVDARALWQENELFGPGPRPALHAAIEHAGVGVATHVSDEVPVALAVMDRSLTFLAIPADTRGETGYLSYAVVESRAFASLMARLFHVFWDEARPLDPSAASTTPNRRGQLAPK